VALKQDAPTDLSKTLDLPFCRADLYHILKLAVILEARNASQ